MARQREWPLEVGGTEHGAWSVERAAVPSRLARLPFPVGSPTHDLGYGQLLTQKDQLTLMLFPDMVATVYGGKGYRKGRGGSRSW